MDYQEAIEILKDFDSQVSAKADGAYQTTIGKMACDFAISAMQDLQKHKKLGTLEEVREAVEKQKRKKPRATTNRCYVCPHCGLAASIKIKHNYCDACGQHIDWSEEEWAIHLTNH